MKIRQIRPNHTETTRAFRGARLLLILAGASGLLGSTLPVDARAAGPADNGQVQEQIGHRIQALGRYDREREVRLRQRWVDIALEAAAFENGRDRRLQENLGQAITQAVRRLAVERAAIETAIVAATDARRRLMDGSWFQERLGTMILIETLRHPEGGSALIQSVQVDAARLQRIEARTLSRVDAHLRDLTARQARLPDAARDLYREAVQSARRSARLLDAAQDTWTSRLLESLQTDLAVQREPEDYVRLASTVRAARRGHWGVWGFWEYGAPSLLGIVFAMAWVGSATRRDFVPNRPSAPAVAGVAPTPYQWRREVIAMSQSTTMFSWPREVIFGSHVSQDIGQHAVKDNVEHAMILTDQGVSEQGLVEPIKTSLTQAGVVCEVYDQVSREVPHTVIADVVGRCKQAGTNLLVALGGGSVIDTAKAVGVVLANGGSIQDYEGVDRVPRPIPLLYVAPTTAGCGSEASQFCIVLDIRNKRKIEIFSRKLIPEKIFIDPVLTRSMPPELTASSGMDALANCIEAYFSTWASPLTDALALHATRLISDSLRAAVANGQNLEARQHMALAAFEAGLAFTNAQSGAVHALGHSVSGMFDVPQRMGDAILLPHVMHANINADMGRMAKVAEALGEPIAGLSTREAAGRAVEAVKCLLVDIGLPTTLGKVGVDKKAISALSEHALQDTFLRTNPRMLNREDIEEIYENAFVEYADLGSNFAGSHRVTVH